jgi:hypothetical protein
MAGKYPSLTLCALAALVCLTTPLLGADQDESAMPPPPQGVTPMLPPPPAGTAAPAATQGQPQSRVLFPGPVPGDIEQSPYLNPGMSSVNDPMVRLGWWATSVSGSAYRVGEYENWSAGPFANIDGLWTNGTRTLDLIASMNDLSDGSVHGYYYGPGTSDGSGAGFAARFDYEGFPHNLGHDPMDNMPNATATTPNSSIVKQDLNAGQDYAIQVQEFKVNLKGQLTDNLRWRVDVFGMEKQGVRQATSVAECFEDHPPITATSTKVCHDVSQAQSIDWKTTEVTPRLEGNWGALTVEYSHPIRIFTANDSTVTRDYFGGSAGALPLSFLPTYQYPYGVVDNNVTNIDQVKIGLNPDGDNKFYAMMLAGNTYNDSIGTNRYFNSVDTRWTNISIENLTLTAFWKQFNECETLVSQANAPFGDYYNPSGTYNTVGNPSVNQDTDRHSEDVGASALWRPFGRGFGLGGLAIHAEYDFQILHRDDAIYGAPPSVALPYNSEIDETYTRTNTFEIRPTVRWSPTFDTYFKYRCTLVDQPLIGVKLLNTYNDSNGGYNTLLPQVDNLAEIGGTWLPTKELVFNGTLGVEQADTNISDPTVAGPSLPINFSQNSYPYSVSMAYTPACSKWTWTGGYANYTNFISQLITMGDGTISPDTYTLGGSGASAGNITPFQTRWGYMGEAEVFDLGTTYRLSKDVKLTGAVQYTHGIDTILPLGSYNVPSTFTDTATGGKTSGTLNYNLTDYPGYSRVIVETTRVQAGIDWRVREHLDTFIRYQYYNFQDPTQPYNTGLVNGFLVGLNWVH